MFYYIYRISEGLKNKLKDLQIAELNIDKINLNFNEENKNEIIGVIDLTNDNLVNSKINFEIDLKYLFLFIETDHPTILNESLQILEQYFNDLGGKLENFLPRVSKEHDLICNSKNYDLKFIHNGEIVDSDSIENLEEKYCNNELSKEFILIEADVKLEDGSSFYYLRKALQIDNETFKIPVFDRFKKVMAWIGIP